VEIEIGLKPINNGLEYAIVEIEDLRAEGKSKELVKAKVKLKVELANTVIATVREVDGARPLGELILPATFNGKPVTRIDNESEKTKWGYTKITVPEGITAIGDNAFYYFDDTEYFSIPGSVRTIGKLAFAGWNYQGSRTIVIADGVETIGAKAFWFSRLNEIVIPESVTYIGDFAFEECESLIKVTLPLNAKFGKDIFKKCSKDLMITTGGKTEKLSAWKKRIKEAEIREMANDPKNIFSGKIVVFTGTLELYTRDVAKKTVENLGGTVANDITSKVNLLVIGKDAGSKAAKAKTQGIEIITEAEFVKMLGDAPVPAVIKFKKDGDKFTASVDWGKNNINITYDDEGDKELNQAAKDFAHQLINRQAELDIEAREILADDLFEMDCWGEDSEGELTEEECLKQMCLGTIFVESDGSFKFWYHGDPIGDHRLILSGTVEDGFDGSTEMFG
jgi:hypothetical protein